MMEHHNKSLNSYFQAYEENGQYFQRLALIEELKTLPYGAIWDYFCIKNNVAIGKYWFKEIKMYEKDILRKRV